VFTDTSTHTPTVTPTDTVTHTHTWTPVYTFTWTDTPTETPTHTNTFTATETWTATDSPTATETATWTHTVTETFTPTLTYTPTPRAEMRLVKTGLPETPKAGDLVRYDLTITVDQSPASAVTLVDDLPTGLLPSTVTFVSGPAGTVVGNQITWVIGTLTPGVVTVSFMVRVDPAAEAEPVLRNVGHATSPDTQDADAYADTKVRGDVQVIVGIYNEAGEVVKRLPVKYLSRPVVEMDLSGDGVIEQLGESVTITWGGGRVLGSWDGEGDNGQQVENGSYFIKVDSVDAYGTTTSVTKSLSLNRRVVRLSIRIYNEAGEVVRRLYAEKPAGSSTVNDVKLSTDVIHPRGDGKDGLQPTVGIVMTDGEVAVWDGTADNGENVSDGSYYIHLTIENVPNSTLEVTKIVSVLGSRPASGETGIRPNVLTASRPVATLHADTLLAGQRIQATIYDLTGRRVGTLVGELGQNDIAFDTSSYSSGLYLARVEKLEGDRRLDRTLRKFIVRR